MYTDCVALNIKVYLDKGQFWWIQYNLNSQSNLNKSFADSFQYAIMLFVFQVWTVSDARFKEITELASDECPKWYKENCTHERCNKEIRTDES